MTFIEKKFEILENAKKLLVDYRDLLDNSLDYMESAMPKNYTNLDGYDALDDIAFDNTHREIKDAAILNTALLFVAHPDDSEILEVLENIHENAKNDSLKTSKIR